MTTSAAIAQLEQIKDTIREIHPDFTPEMTFDLGSGVTAIEMRLAEKETAYVTIDGRKKAIWRRRGVDKNMFPRVAFPTTHHVAVAAVTFAGL